MKTGLNVVFFLPVILTQVAAWAMGASKPETLTELHLQLCGSNPQAMIRALQPEDAQTKSRDVYFIDTDDLDLYRNNIIVRVRGRSAEKMKVTVKIRHLSAEAVDPRWFGLPDFKCEVDSFGDRGVEDCSITEEVSSAAWNSVRRDARSSSVLLSARQHAFLTQYGRFQPVWEATRLFGAIPSWVSEGDDEGLGREISLEYWRLPRNQFILEISTRASREESNQVASELAEYVADHGVSVCNPQSSKTLTALQALKGSPKRLR